jgi:hypothetical protein
LKRIGFIVEDKSDFDVLCEFARKISRGNFAVKRSLGHGCGRIIGKCRAWAQELQRQGCSVLVLACDLDEQVLSKLAASLRDALEPCPIQRNIIVIPVREIEAWLLADHAAITRALRLKKALKLQANPEAVRRPKERLRDLVWERSGGSIHYLNTVHNGQIAKNCQVANLRRCNSFIPFEKFVRAQFT